MYDARAIVEAIGTAITDAVEQGEAPFVDGEPNEESEINIVEATEKAQVGRSIEAEAFIHVRTSDGRTWRVYAEEIFV